jgi:hypothetical protein
MPERDGNQLAASERRQATAQRDYIIDGTERRRQRPKKPDKQADHYSGKKKVHSDKNIVVVQQLKTGRLPESDLCRKDARQENGGVRANRLSTP